VSSVVTISCKLRSLSSRLRRGVEEWLGGTPDGTGVLPGFSAMGAISLKPSDKSLDIRARP
jgi:hypothetical protein